MQSLSLTDVQFVRLLGNDLYMTYECIINDTKCVVKFFTDKSDDNNETEVMAYLRSNSSKPWLYPVPYFSLRGIDEYTIILADSEEPNIITGIFRVICYQYIDGETVKNFPICGEKDTECLCEKMKSDVLEHLEDIHSFGFVFVDVREDNILHRADDGRYQLIDFGRVFHIIDEQFPPMEYMINDIRCDVSLPTQEEDFERVETIVAKCNNSK